MGFSLSYEFPQKVLHAHPLTEVVEKVAAEIVASQDPAVREDRNILQGCGATPSPPSFFSVAADTDLDYSGKGNLFSPMLSRRRSVQVTCVLSH